MGVCGGLFFDECRVVVVSFDVVVGGVVPFDVEAGPVVEHRFFVDGHGELADVVGEVGDCWSEGDGEGFVVGVDAGWGARVWCFAYPVVGEG